MRDSSDQKWYNSNPLVAIATIAIAALAFIIPVLTERVQPPHLYISILVVLCLIAAGACLVASYKFERNFDRLSKLLADEKEEDELEVRLKYMRQQLANVEWLKRKSEFQDFEKSDDTDEVWVLTFDFRYELFDFRDIVIANLIKGRRYKYIYPQDARHHLHHFKGILYEAGIAEETVNKQVEFYELDKRIVPLNEAIYNPVGRKKKRAIIMTPEFEFEYYIELNPEQTGRMIEKFESLIEDAKRINLFEIQGESGSAGQK